ncbi:Bax inhibitor-1 family protein [Wielerella bovis]|uniref:Bax inhibitor-1 family protein n=1 Tax=Wielerella bovis TaxID=2917790 RepID=UPI00201956A5|nr:Bax inhibitor-1 family protein [Wielerella bovis]MCG7657366.1 Bax inhibitor-1 family protein [Wielerella bovis]MCG7659587.1 Bax inhibitor-1 family protein [Wielerella bovis]
MNNDVRDFTQMGTEVSQQETLLRKTYGLLAWSFVPCAAGAYASMVFNPLAMVGNRWVMLAVVFGFFYGMCFAIEKNRYSQTGVILLMVFTFGMGVLLGPLLQYSGMFPNGGKLVGIAATMTAAVFFTMAALARKANINTNALGKFLATGAIVLIVGIVANIFLQLPMLSLSISGLFVVFSSLMIMWQVRMVLEGGEDSHISAALSIFIAIYNLFSSLLHLLLAFAGSDD